jgi:hypothetical protein
MRGDNGEKRCSKDYNTSMRVMIVLPIVQDSQTRRSRQVVHRRKMSGQTTATTAMMMMMMQFFAKWLKV